MGDKTGIEWTDATWNPIVGCSIVSPGCTNCYAMKWAAQRLDGSVDHYAGTTKTVNGNAVWTGKVALATDHIVTAPLRWKKPRRIFVNSMGDLFHESVPDEWIDRVFAVMALAPQHTFQVLTKRSKRMREYMTRPVQGPWAGRALTIDDDGTQRDMTDVRMRMISVLCVVLPTVPGAALNAAAKWQDDHYPHGDGFIRKWPLSNVWLGVSTEDQARADERIPDLLATPAAIRFVSAEPLLGPVDFTECPRDDALLGYAPDYSGDRHKLDWIIVGGESGKDARPMHPDWVRSIRDQCAAAGVPLFFKQWGEFRPPSPLEAFNFPCHVLRSDGTHLRPIEDDGDSYTAQDVLARVGKRRAGNLLDGKTHIEFPEAK